MSVAATVPRVQAPSVLARLAHTMSATPGQIALSLAIVAFLALFLIVPVGTVIYVAFTEKGTSDVHAGQFHRFLSHGPVRAVVLEFGLRLGDVGGAGLDLRAAACLHHHTVRFSRRHPDPDPRLPAAHHAALRGRGRHAAAVRAERHRQSPARRLVRLQDLLHGGPERRHLRAGGALFPVHPHQSFDLPAQHRPRHGRGGAESRQLRASDCSAASSSRSPCRATSPAHRWFS